MLTETWTAHFFIHVQLDNIVKGWKWNPQYVRSSCWWIYYLYSELVDLSVLHTSSEKLHRWDDGVSFCTCCLNRGRVVYVTLKKELFSVYGLVYVKLSSFTPIGSVTTSLHSSLYWKMFFLSCSGHLAAKLLLHSEISLRAPSLYFQAFTEMSYTVCRKKIHIECIIFIRLTAF